MRTQEEKELLLQDLCARLSYGVIVNVKGFDYDYNDKLTQIYKGYGCSIQVTTNMPYDIEQVKPYLFPLSSMTEEQRMELNSLLPVGVSLQINSNNFTYFEINTDLVCCFHIEFWDKFFDWLYKHHIDFRGLIEKSLALDATGLNIY